MFINLIQCLSSFVPFKIPILRPELPGRLSQISDWGEVGLQDAANIVGSWPDCLSMVVHYILLYYPLVI